MKFLNDMLESLNKQNKHTELWEFHDVDEEEQVPEAFICQEIRRGKIDIWRCISGSEDCIKSFTRILIIGTPSIRILEVNNVNLGKFYEHLEEAERAIVEILKIDSN